MSVAIYFYLLDENAEVKKVKSSSQVYLADELDSNPDLFCSRNFYYAGKHKLQHGHACLINFIMRMSFIFLLLP